MVFTSWVFVRFFIVFFSVFLVLPTRGARQLLVLCASIYFYGSWKASYLLLLAAPSIVDYVCASRIEATANTGVRRLWVTASVVSNLGLLGYFKYADFFLANLDALLGRRFKPLEILLPVGISFYTFKTLSYTIDVYRRDIPACKSWWRYAMFVSYFPELVAGPIVRASIFLPQMTRSLRPNWNRSVVGFQLVLLGFTKKLMIADRLAPFADPVFASPSTFSPGTVLMGIVAYSLQIYCDFSGYSDIAIGISYTIGFDLPENFNMPYASTSITEFWRRWHMTLSQWLRDYLYIPLGGNRKGRVRTYVNLIVTMLLGGLWHGANWTFVCWGLLHGTGLALHKLWTSWSVGRIRPLPRPVAWLTTYTFVCFGWVFFRAPSFSVAATIIRKILWIDRGGVTWVYAPLLLLVPITIAAHWIGVHVASLPRKRHRVGAPEWLQSMYQPLNGTVALKPHRTAGLYVLLPLPGFWGVFALTLWIVTFILSAVSASTPFIYFQF